jgi:peptidoglycan/LPS O-acetylase OafA/YrhL
MFKKEMAISDNSKKFVWMDLVRGTAIIAIVIHHWLLFMPYENSKLALFIHTVAGTFIHLFFVLSGCGLTISYFQTRPFTWTDWARRRFARLIVPYWIIITSTVILVNLSHFVVPKFIAESYSWTVLLTYLTFLRNFYSPAWQLNPTFWFMPVILGLYLLFPILVKILEKYGVLVLLAISILITYLSIYFFFGFSTNHQSSVPLFHLSEFSLGMSLGYLQLFYPPYFDRLTDFKIFCLGILLYTIAWAMATFWEYGPSYDDLFTAAGICLITLYACRWMIRLSPCIWIQVLTQFSKESYTMYLIHGPLILYLAKPIFTRATGPQVNSLIMIILSPLFCFIVFLLAKLISPLINRLQGVRRRNVGGLRSEV